MGLTGRIFRLNFAPALPINVRSDRGFETVAAARGNLVAGAGSKRSDPVLAEFARGQMTADYGSSRRAMRRAGAPGYARPGQEKRGVPRGVLPGERSFRGPDHGRARRLVEQIPSFMH